VDLSTATPTVQQAEGVQTSTSYPSTPEDVIQSFLMSYPVDPVYAVQFLSPSLVKDLDADSVARLLPGSGDIKGFIIESGASSAEAEKSEILTNIAFDDLSAQVMFTLEIVDGRWVINKITQK